MAKTDTALPDLSAWYSLGYDTPPFSCENQNNQFFFKSQALINTLNKLCTLDSSETCVTTLVGEQGCGKTTCLKAINKLQTTYQNNLIMATKGLTAPNLIKAIFTKKISSRKPSTEECINLLKELTNQNKQHRILIDNAEKLPDETISLIKIISEIQPNGSQIQFVFCSNNSDTHLRISSNQKIKTQTIQLNNLSKEETEKYINLKLQQNKTVNQQHTLSKEYIDQLFQKTQGNLYKINKEATRSLPEQLLSQSNCERRIEKEDKTTKNLLIYLIIPFGITFAILMLPTFYIHAPANKSFSQKVAIQTVHFKKEHPFPTKKLSRIIHILNTPQNTFPKTS